MDITYLPDMTLYLFIKIRSKGLLRYRLNISGGHAEKVEEFCMDMSPAFIKGVGDYFPKAEITFD